MVENHYTNAINNLDHLVHSIKANLPDDTLGTLQYNLMTLKLYPYYQGPREVPE
jgi:hypothetical protein